MLCYTTCQFRHYPADLSSEYVPTRRWVSFQAPFCFRLTPGIGVRRNHIFRSARIWIRFCIALVKYIQTPSFPLFEYFDSIPLAFNFKRLRGSPRCDGSCQLRGTRVVAVQKKQRIQGNPKQSVGVRLQDQNDGTILGFSHPSCNHVRPIRPASIWP